jgi:hypothetical protein
VGTFPDVRETCAVRRTTAESRIGIDMGSSTRAVPIAGSPFKQVARESVRQPPGQPGRSSKGLHVGMTDRWPSTRYPGFLVSADILVHERILDSGPMVHGPSRGSRKSKRVPAGELEVPDRCDAGLHVVALAGPMPRPLAAAEFARPHHRDLAEGGFVSTMATMARSPQRLDPTIVYVIPRRHKPDFENSSNTIREK